MKQTSKSSKKRATKVTPKTPTIPLQLPYSISSLSSYYEVKVDQEALDHYLMKYFECYPRRRKKPLEKPFPISLNKWLVMNKDQRNELKQHYEDLMWTIVHRNGWETLNLDKCHVEVWYVFGDKRRSDLDNRILKAFYDGLTRAGFLKDDNRFVIPSTDYRSVYEKGVWATVLRFYPIPEEVVIE